MRAGPPRKMWSHSSTKRVIACEIHSGSNCARKSCGLGISRKIEESGAMTTLVVRGGNPLNGRVRVRGNKNAALPVMAACLLTEEECVLENVPRIRDVEVMAELLRQLGAVVAWEGEASLRIRAETISSTEPRTDLVAKLRGSVLLLGPLLARKGEAILGAPGGDFPSRRNLNQ